MSPFRQMLRRTGFAHLYLRVAPAFGILLCAYLWAAQSGAGAGRGQEAFRLGASGAPRPYGTGENPVAVLTGIARPPRTNSVGDTIAAASQLAGRPSDMDKIGITQGEGRLKKRSVSVGGTGQITDALVLPSGKELVLAGDSQSVRVDIGSLRVSQVLCQFRHKEDESIFVKILPSEGRKEVSAYIVADRWGGPTRAMDAAGDLLWQGYASSGVNHMVIRDLLPQSVGPEVILTCNADGGIVVLTSDGRQALHYVGDDAVNVWCGEVVSPLKPGSAKAGLVFLSANPGLHVLDPTSVTATVVPAVKCSSLSVLPANPVSSGPAIVVPGGGRLLMFQPDGTPLATLDSPFADDFCDVYAVLLHRTGPPSGLLVAVLDASLWERSVVLVYDGEGKLFYREVLDGATTVLLPATGACPWDFLVGGKDQVAVYSVQY